MKRLIPALFLIFFSCTEESSTEIKNTVTVRLKKFPSSINFLTSGSQEGTLIQWYTFNRLLWFDENQNLQPLLVESLPTIEKKEGDHLTFSFKLRKEAFWPNGEKITGKDVSFSLKVFKLPIDNIDVRTQLYLKNILQVEEDKVDNSSISITAIGNMNDIMSVIGDFDVFQKSKFDPTNLLDNITFADIQNTPEEVANNENVKAFVDEFLKDNFKFKGKFLSGSGPYEITGVEQGKFIRLKKKVNWWGESLVGKLPQFHAYPEEILYACIPEPIVAIHALKAKNLDVMDDIPASEFIQLKKDSSFLKDFNLFSPLKYRFTYIGLNSRIKYLNNIEIRKAIAHLVKPNDMIKVVEKGYGERTIGPINPIKKYYYNQNISPREYDLDLALQILLENGFELQDGNLIDPKTEEPLEFDVAFRKNPGYESIAVLLKQEVAKIGIKLNLKQYEGRTMSKMARNHDYEIMVGAFNGNHSLNFNDIFSRESAKIGGINFTGFGNEKSDSLIHAANYAADSLDKKSALYALQEQLHEEATMLFLYFSKNKIAISKKFENLKISSTKPGYDVTSFILKSPVSSN